MSPALPFPGTEPTKEREAITVGAVDLGSNSFHMVIARSVGDDVSVIDKHREPVRLAEGIRKGDTIRPEVQERALECLRRFGERLRDIPASQVRAVGTNSLRRARRDFEFRARAREALGHSIEIISGQEEARLVYQGINHAQPFDGRRFAVDIGGGSTEVIVGEGPEIITARSLYMGCVSYSRRYFAGGEIQRESFRTAETAVALELRSVRNLLRDLGWETAIGSSGTVNAISDLLFRNDFGGPEITMAGLKRLRKLLVQAGSTGRIALEGLKSERAAVLPGGLAILIGVFRNLEIESMFPSSGALREGVLWDLLGRLHRRDVRDRTIRGFVDRYHVDTAQAARVESTATRLLEQLGAPEGIEPETARSLLSWAAWLHEIGLAISYSGYHRHGAYLVGHADLPGFSADDQILLAALVGGHRRKLGSALDPVPSGRRTAARHLLVLLRLAVLMHRSRHDDAAPPAKLTRTDEGLTLEFPAGFAEEHPLTSVDLDREQRYLAEADIRLQIVES